MANYLGDLSKNVKETVAETDLSDAVKVITTSMTRQYVHDCTENDVRVLKNFAAKIVAKTATPVSELFKEPWQMKWSRISFSCKSLDRCTLGGIVTRSITEICGKSGAGKSQLLLQLSLAVQLPTSLGGLGKGVAFICTECNFPSKRIFQMAKSFAKRYPEHDINFLNNIYIEHVRESQALLKCVEERLKELMETVGIGLIIIDSVAAVFRIQTDYIQRARDMRKLANSLLHYTDKYNCGVICVNQVTAAIDKNTEVPCLGLAWAFLGRTRIKISKVPKQVKIKNLLLTVRKFEIMYSPDTPNDFAEFLITEQGVVDVP